MKQLTYIAPRRLGIISGIIHGLIGLILLPFLLLKIAFDQHAGGLPAIFGTAVFTLFLPVVYAAAGFVGGLIIANLYNLIAKRIGGLEFKMTDEAGPDRLLQSLAPLTKPLDLRGLIVGIWRGQVAGKFVGVYTFYADGNVQRDAGRSDQSAGQWDVAGDSVLVKWDQGATDIIELTSPQQYRWTNAQLPGGGIATRQ